jgi:acetyltransferase-like isoleucine patch superfamily enzyme
LECGKNIKVWGIVDIVKMPKTQIKIGNNVSLNSSSVRTTASTLYSRIRLRTDVKGAKIIIDDNVGLNGTSITARSRTITIREGTMIAPNVIVVDSDFHSLWPPENRLTSSGFENDEDVNIGKNVWIGMNSIILKGVQIGDNSIIGAGSVVTTDIPPNCVARGNPASVVKQFEVESTL